MSALDKFFNMSEVKRLLAGVEAVGSPVLYTQSDGDPAMEGINLPANAGSATTKLSLSKKSIPKLEDLPQVVSYIKQVRAQFRVRQVLQDIADNVTHGFRVKGSPEVSAFFYQTELLSKVNRIAFELATMGWCCVYVSEPRDKKTLPNVSILHNVQVRRAVDGSYLVFLQLTDDAKAHVTAYPQYYPPYWAQEVGNDLGINITRVVDKKGNVSRGGAYFVRLEADAEDIFPVPPLYPLLQYLPDSEKILGGMSNMVDMLKYYLIHVLVGNKDGQELSNGRVKPVGKDLVSAILHSLTVGYNAGAFVSPANIEIQEKFPDNSPYSHHHKAVHDYRSLAKKDLGVPDFESISSEGVASFVARGFLPTMERLRGIIEAQFLRPLMQNQAKRVSGLEQARIVWGVDNVQELKTLIERGKFQLGTGGKSITTLNELVDPDYDFDLEMNLKQTELGSKDLVGMIWEPSQNLSVQAKEMEQVRQQMQPAVPQDGPTDPSQKPKPPSPLDNPTGRPTA